MEDTTRTNEIVAPDVCTSLHCTPPQDHCRHCSHALFLSEVHVNGQRWPFEFNPIFGVQFTRLSDGQPKAVQPSEKHPVWAEWTKWHEEKFLDHQT